MGTRKSPHLFLYLFSITLLIINPSSSSTGYKPVLHNVSRETDLFRQWRDTHGKVYSNDEETGKCFENFKRNLDYIHESESDRVRFSVGLNRFADLSNEEFRERYFGDVKRPVRFGEPRKRRLDLAGTCYAPLSVDWRAKGVVSPVKDQGACGSSWAFSSIGAIEGINAINNGELVSISEQALIDCDNTNNGCKGGYKEYAFEWVINNGGIYTQADYPYTQAHGTCNANKVANNSVYVDGYEIVEESEDALLCAAVNQPISVGVHGSSIDFQLYTGGIYDGACSNNPDLIDHSLLIVGYGSEGYTDYWIVKNSWGSNWGMNGYMYIRRNTNLPHGVCSINSLASYPTQTSSVMVSDISSSPSPSPSTTPPLPSLTPPPPPSPPPPAPSPPTPTPPPPSSHDCGDYSYCGPGQTCCCLYEFCGFCMIHGCCDYIHGVCCAGTDYCCPRDYPICDPDEGFCLKKSGDCLGVPSRKKIPARLKLPWRKPEGHTEMTYEPLRLRMAGMR